MCIYFKAETDGAQNLINYFFLTLNFRRPFHRMWLLSEETDALHAELNKRVEAATSSYSAVINFLQYIFSVLVAKYH